MIFYDGDKKEQIIDLYRDKTNAPPITSLSNTMLIHFTSNSEKRYSGFKLEYQEYKKQSKMDFFKDYYSPYGLEHNSKLEYNSTLWKFK